jgi:hypothetical protein
LGQKLLNANASAPAAATISHRSPLFFPVTNSEDFPQLIDLASV